MVKGGFASEMQFKVTIEEPIQLRAMHGTPGNMDRAIARGLTLMVHLSEILGLWNAKYYYEQVWGIVYTKKIAHKRYSKQPV